MNADQDDIKLIIAAAQVDHNVCGRFAQAYQDLTGRNPAAAPARIKKLIAYAFERGLTEHQVHIVDRPDRFWNARRNRTCEERQAAVIGYTNSKVHGYCVSRLWAYPRVTEAQRAVQVAEQQIADLRATYTEHGLTCGCRPDHRCERGQELWTAYVLAPYRTDDEWLESRRRLTAYLRHYQPAQRAEAEPSRNVLQAPS